MWFKEEHEIVIHAPREAVWAAFQDFASWPTWSSYIKEVSRLDRAWRFRARAQPPVDLIWVVEAVRREAPEYLAFQSVADAPHNLILRGWVRITQEADLTRLHLELEGKPHYESPWLGRAADWYAATFGEPNKVVKLTFEQFKHHLERQHAPQAAVTPATQP